MKEIANFLVGLVLFLLAWALFLPISFLNFFIVGLKFKDLGYFKSSAVNLDRFGNSEFRTLFNLTLKKKEGYKFGNMEETISSVLGKNQREEVNAMRKYEIMYIINPTVLEEGREELINQVNALLTSNGATIAKTEKWGERKLAYPIDKKKSGFY